MATSVRGDTMFTETSHGTVRLCRLTECPPDLCAEIHRVCLEAPNYFLSSHGALPDENGIRQWFSEDELPWGCTADHHFVYSITLESGLIGIAHVLAACRDPQQATIGLLLLSERHQGQGLGQAVFDLLAGRMSEWGLKSCIIGVVTSNVSALAFWRRVGFKEVGEVPPMDGFVDRTIFMEKKLA